MIIKQLVLLICITLICVSCETDKQRLKFVCTCEQMVKVEDFIKTTISDANNMADEEMEDVIFELRRTAIIVNCSQELVWIDGRGFYLPEKNKLDSCKIVIH